MKEGEQELVGIRIALAVAAREAGRLPRLGFASVDFSRWYRRDFATLASLADELGSSVQELRAAEMVEQNDISRAETRLAEEASERVLLGLQRLLPPVRQIVLERALGMSWKRICRAHPDRAVWSMMDDLSRGLARLSGEVGRDLEFLCFTARKISPRELRCGARSRRRSRAAPVV